MAQKERLGKRGQAASFFDEETYGDSSGEKHMLKINNMGSVAFRRYMKDRRIYVYGAGFCKRNIDGLQLASIMMSPYPLQDVAMTKNDY